MTSKKQRRIIKQLIESTRSLMHQHQITSNEAALKVVSEMTPDELVALIVTQLDSGVQREIRKYAYEVTLAPDQMILMGMERSVPPYIVVENNGNTYELEKQDATPNQIVAHYEMVHAHLKQKLGIVDRDGKFWQDDFTGERDVPIGQQVFAGIPCAICGLPWRLGDPFERAHDVPVAAATGDSAWQWAHRSCNNAEGTGGRVYEIDG